MGIIQPVRRPILQPLVHPYNVLRGGDALTAAVRALFASGEKGVMFDFTQASNLFTDSARTTLVTASGDKIGSMTDLSPNGKHGSSTGAKRPTWNSAGYATFDAFDDYLQTAAIDFSATDAVTVVVAVRKNSDAVRGVLYELSPDINTNNGTFAIEAPDSAGAATYRVRSKGTVMATISYSGFAAGTAYVVTLRADISDDTVSAVIDGVQQSPSLTDQGTGNYGNYVLNIGARNAASLFFNGRIYRLLVIGRALTTTERNAAERWAAQPVGITIP